MILKIEVSLEHIVMTPDYPLTPSWISFTSFINLKIEVSFEPIIMIFDFPSTLSLILR